jgi:CheY-like chemotaxis protein
MDDEVRQHLFEPFFTTKSKDRGTGLGLATVYGIVKQNQGVIVVDSKPGEGTSITIFLPATQGEPAMLNTTPEPPSIGHGVVLLVEDEDQVRNLSRRILERNGYKVLPAASGGEALILAEKFAGEINLLLADVVMPNMNGKELYERLRGVRPGLRALYMSGYTDDVIAHHGLLEPGIQFLQKPFTAIELAKKVEGALRA